jgi:hypothetical protein
MIGNIGKRYVCAGIIPVNFFLRKSRPQRRSRSYPLPPAALLNEGTLFRIGKTQSSKNNKKYPVNQGRGPFCNR